MNVTKLFDPAQFCSMVCTEQHISSHTCRWHVPVKLYKLQASSLLLVPTPVFLNYMTRFLSDTSLFTPPPPTTTFFDFWAWQTSECQQISQCWLLLRSVDSNLGKIWVYYRAGAPKLCWTSDDTVDTVRTKGLCPLDLTTVSLMKGLTASGLLLLPKAWHG